MTVLSPGRRWATKYFAGVLVTAVSLLGIAMPAVAATPPTLTVVVLGSGTVMSQPAGITCPGTCIATFAAGTTVRLSAGSKNGSKFLGWGGSCTGTGACTVKVSTLTAVAAKFAAGPKPQPQPAPTKSLAAPGGYSGTYLGYDWATVTFFVSPGGRSLLNISVPSVAIACTPPGSFPRYDHLSILDTAINPNGSFTATSTQQGVFDNVSAKFTYWFAGYVEGATPAGPVTLAGTLREDIVFAASGANETCTSNDQSWTAVRS